MKYGITSLGIASVMLLSASAFATDVKLELKKQLNLPKIIGGVVAIEGERPWVASLQFDGEHFCGGSLIDSRWVLTAAHCVEDIDSADLDALQVRAGFTDLEAGGTGSTRKIQRVLAHPGYAQGEAADIALLELSEPMPADYAILPMATPSVMQASGFPGQMANVSGWGNTIIEGENFPRKLRTVAVPLVSNATCNLPQSYDGEVTDMEICAGFEAGGRDSCQGDSGGPLVVNHEGEPHQVGVVSWGDGCALPDKYGVYARVESFNDWILGSMSGTTSGGSNGGSVGGVVAGELQSGQLATGLSAEQGDQRRFEIRVPQGARLLWIDITGGSGDADLYVQNGKEPTIDDYQFAPFREGNREHVLVRRPKAGTWHIMIDAYDSFNGVELMGVVR